MDRINVAIIGQGRSGRDIHGKFFKSEKNTIVNVIAVAEWNAVRRERALEEYPGCQVYEDYRDFYSRDDIDLVVNASYSQDHFAITKDLLENGMNVVCEKPFARNRYECDTLIKLAKEKGLLLAVFQQSFLATFYEEAKKVISSGKLGRIEQIDITYSNFARRWDWQTTQVKMGGNTYNTGPHPIGLALGFLDFDEDTQVVFSKLSKTEFSMGDSDDFAKIILTAPGKPIIDIEIHSNDAFPADNIKILGSKGTYKCTLGHYEMKYIVEGENKEQLLELGSLMDSQAYPLYCRESLNAHTESGEYVGDPFDKGTEMFYYMVYNKMKNNVPMQVTPEQAAMIVGVIETVHAANPLPLKF